jgi:UDP-N-acetylmuramoyl-L-alanyl-D-glutamate--2,6-diaminopimelate ligase
MSRYPISPRSVRDLITASELDSTVEFVGFDSDLVTIEGLTQDSRSVQPGDLYCCVRGDTFDGHDFARQAVADGAVALVVDRHIDDLPDHVAVVRVDDVRSVLGKIASCAFGAPSTSLTMVGITGTNGKTSTAAMMSAILVHAGHRVETMGTLSGVRTTPEAIDLHWHLYECVGKGITHVVMEVSSHALAQHRVGGVIFDVAVFTNIGRDHLDFHGTEEAYFAAKAKLFEPHQSRVGVVNIDDARGQLLTDVAPIEMVPFSLSDASDISVHVEDVSFTWREEHIEIPIGGLFTVMNAVAAATGASALGISMSDIVGGLKSLSPIAGRFQPVVNDMGIGVIVDYAHTPEGLEQLLATTRSVCEGRLIVVFGCGGDRDHGKRPIMGRIAADRSDVVIVTSDNPRTENPDEIIGQILSGVDTGARHKMNVVADRAAAITSAILLAKRGDIVVIAGKGHELTQEVNGVHFSFSDVEQAHEALREKGGTSQ